MCTITTVYYMLKTVDFNVTLHDIWNTEPNLFVPFCVQNEAYS